VSTKALRGTVITEAMAPKHAAQATTMKHRTGFTKRSHGRGVVWFEVMAFSCRIGTWGGIG
jgi:hypothetical protein